MSCHNAQSNNDQLGNIPKGDIEKITFDFDRVIKSLEEIDLRKEVLIWLPYDEYGGIDDIDPNARLIAKEAKINTWDMSLINSLLDIYDKPRIVK